MAGGSPVCLCSVSETLVYGWVCWCAVSLAGVAGVGCIGGPGGGSKARILVGLLLHEGNICVELGVVSG